MGADCPDRSCQYRNITDHSALKVLDSRTAKCSRVVGRALALAEYDYEIVHHEEKIHEDVVCLSRAPVDSPDEVDYLEHVYNILVIHLDPEDWVRACDDEKLLNNC